MSWTRRSSPSSPDGQHFKTLRKIDMSRATNPVNEPPAPEAVGEQLQQYLTFMLSGEVFAMGILAVKEIIEYANLTAVPMMP